VFANGCDCSIVIKTSHCEKDIPYSNETIREAVSILEEEAAIEGAGTCKAIRKSNGVTGCVVTPLTIGTVPLLLYLAMGSVGKSMYVSETRDIYQYQLDLRPMEDTDCFDLIQQRNNERLLLEDCRVKGFELRIMRDELIKLKLDITGERNPVAYPYTDKFDRATGERFDSNTVSYRINNKEYPNIYGITLVSRKEGGTKTELWIKRALEDSSDLPQIIDEIVINAQLLRDKYEYKQYGMFRITIKRLVLVSDETEINAVDTVIGPIRYYVAGAVTTQVYSTAGELIQ
jgi:hypothetical protein